MGNPDVLIQLLDDLIDSLTRWKVKSSELMADSKYVQKNSNDIVNRSENKTRIINNQSNEDRIKVEQQNVQICELYNKHRNYKEKTVSLEAETNKLKNNALQTLALWREELRKAINWLQAAEQDLSNARAELSYAMAQFSRAQSRLREAEQNLVNCKNSAYKGDKGTIVRPDCRPFENAVEDAKNDVTIAQARVSNAQSWVRRAAQEVEKARKRVGVCKQAVALSEKACSAANIALKNASSAVDFSERAIENTEAAIKNCSVAETMVNEQIDLAEDMRSRTQIILRDNNLANLSLNKSDQFNTDIYNYATSGNQVIKDRLIALREFAAEIK